MKMDTIQDYTATGCKSIIGVYSPKPNSPYVNLAEHLIGKECVFDFGFIQEVGEYSGRVILIPRGWDSTLQWVPLEDIEQIRELE